MDKVRRAEPQRGRSTALFQFGRGIYRVGRQAERGNQGQQGLVRSFAGLAEGVGISRLDADDPGEADQRSAAGHIPRRPVPRERN